MRQALLRRQSRGVKALLLLVALALALGVLAGCGDDDDDAPPPAPAEGEGQEVTNIAFFGFAAANSFAQATWAGIQEVAEREGVQARFYDPNFDAQTQVRQIQDAIASGRYQALIVQANDGNAVVPAVQEAIAEGITVVGEFTPIGTAYDTIEPQVDGLIFVGEPPTENGETLGDMAVEACEDRDPCRIVYLEGFRALPLDNARTQAFVDRIAQENNAQVIARVEGGYTRESGLAAAQDVLQAQQQIDVMVGSSQAIAGAEQAINDAGREGIQLIGNGGSEQAVTAVREERWFGAYIIAERDAGARAAELAIQAARGEDVPTSFDTRELQEPRGTRDNLGDYEGQYRD
jgi:ribose transport system substrate-binding protein